MAGERGLPSASIEGENPYRNARSDDEVLSEEFDSPYDPTGIWLRPAVLGWFGDAGIDAEEWLRNPPPNDLDPTRFTDLDFEIKNEGISI